MATINDVSRAAGVSTATVSRVLNHPQQVDENTRENVLAAIKSLNYRRNEVARGLASQSSRTIGIVINLFASVYYGRLLDGAINLLRPLGFHALAESSGETTEGELRALDSLMQRQCDALILHSSSLRDNQLADLMKSHPNVMLMNRFLEGFESRCVYLDNELGGRMAAEHLVANGHTKIAMVCGTREYYETHSRRKGFLEFLAKHSIAIDPAHEVDGAFNEIGGTRAMEKLVATSKDMTAIFFQNDDMAVGAMAFCKQRGIKIPEDLSIIGFDDIKARFVSPGLTTVRQPVREIGRASAQLAYALATKTDLESGYKSQIRVFEPELIIRSTVASL